MVYENENHELDVMRLGQDQPSSRTSNFYLKQTHTPYDSLFCWLFGQPKYGKELVNSVQFPSVSNVVNVTLKNNLWFSNTIRNDLALLCDGRLLCFFEAQSFSLANLPVRLLFYCVETLRGRPEMTEGRLQYSSTKIMFPSVQCFVVYSGDGKCKRNMQLLDHFQDRHGIAMDVTIIDREFCKIIDSGSDSPSIVSQYLSYCAITSSVKKQGLEGEAAVRAIIDTCIKNNILVTVMRQQKEEVSRIMTESFDMEKHLLEMRECLLAEGKAMEKKQLLDFTIKELRKENLDPRVIERIRNGIEQL